MPLEKGSSSKVIGHNVSEMEASGHPKKQAVAAALHTAYDEEGIEGQDAGWEEGKHKRGQPGNAGEFASGSGGGSKKTVSDPITKTNVPIKPIKQQAGGPTSHSGVPDTEEQRAKSQEHHEANASSKGAEERFMQPKTKSGAENSPLSALRKHVTGAVESGKSEAITEQPAEQKYKTSLSSEQGRKAHRTIAEAFNSGKSMKLGNYTTDGKAIYLHGNKIVEKGPNGEINFTLAGWPTNTTRSSLRDFGINVSTKQGKQNYSHSGGTEEIESNKMYRAKDEQPALALDPNSGSSSAVPYKGRNLDNDPVGDRSAARDCSGSGADAAPAVWSGRTL